VLLTYRLLLAGIAALVGWVVLKSEDPWRQVTGGIVLIPMLLRIALVK
jgi:hypothetical protein